MSALLAVDGLRLAHGGREVLRAVGFSVAPGEICALMGLSGAGKSSALRAVAALQRFETGTITAAGFALQAGPTPPESRLGPLRRRVGLVFQGHALFEHLTALENVTLALRHVLGQGAAEAARRATELLELLEVSERSRAYPGELSGGEAQRVAIARALAPDPPLLLMDEPTAALDPARRAGLGEVLRRLAVQGRGLLIATHDTAFARAHADRAFVLAEGVIVESGPAATVLEQPTHEATRRLLQADAHRS
ncbi:MAG: amino acid ABC transporter ATP-binding protein [Gemmatimonadetes bacterium]|nr:amino acid ABC transporter ATP-binding protein [Gemmatimonadota bacterium]MBI2403273.1 amino acid ABC transporter ATP-binding protein [Gemmatimonadota bacterium]